MTYKEMYDQLLNELYQAEVDAVSFLKGTEAARLYEEHDPIAYRSGFSDWLDSISRDDILCPECHKRDIDSETVCNASEDDTVQCGVCAGTHDECRDCAELKEVSDLDDCGRCESCRAEAEEEEEAAEANPDADTDASETNTNKGE